MALENMDFKRPNWSHLGRTGWGEERRRVKEEEEEMKRSQDKANKVWIFGFLVWKLNLCMDSMRFCMNFHALMVILLPKSRVFARVSS